MVKDVQNGRLYPETFPEFEYEPTADRFEIVRTDDYADGLITKTAFHVGEVVFRFTGLMLNEVTLYTLQYLPGYHIHDPYVMGKVLHSCSPNMHCDMESLVFTAVREIEPGEYLTMDYETTEDELYRPFQCMCGSPLCRGVIRGRVISDAITSPVAI